MHSIGNRVPFRTQSISFYCFILYDITFDVFSRYVPICSNKPEPNPKLKPYLILNLNLAGELHSEGEAPPTRQRGRSSGKNKSTNGLGKK